MICRLHESAQGCMQLGAHLVGHQAASCSPVVIDGDAAPYRAEPCCGFVDADPKRQCQLIRRFIFERQRQSFDRNATSPRAFFQNRIFFGSKLHLHSLSHLDYHMSGCRLMSTA